ncbi:glycosyltransferase [Roseomonas sp. CAU 1739]|uniref:glycosyltransferase n=1 Tax=Roseomonas sp. CAU 1739 TaxID=3140364 RepID=UPI00325A7737
MARISVAVVTRNAEAEIRGTLDSILSQTMPLELVVVDGASTDGTLAACEDFRDSIDVLVSEPDGGPYNAMNKAAGLATGDYILYMNAGDCFASEDALERLFRHAPESADFIYGHHFYRLTDGAMEWHRAADLAFIHHQVATGHVNFHTIAGMPCHQSSATRRTMLVAQGYDTTYRIAADHARIHQMLAEGREYYHADVDVSIYSQGGLSGQQQALCNHEWYRMLSEAAGPKAPEVLRFFVERVRPGIAESPVVVARQIAQVRESGIFMEGWYRATYGLPANIEPIEHYLYVGVRSNFRPNPFFDGDHYLERNGDVAKAGMNPLMHYVLYGAKQMRLTYPWERSRGWVRGLLAIHDPHRQTLAELLDRVAALKPAEVEALMALATQARTESMQAAE